MKAKRNRTATVIIFAAWGILGLAYNASASVIYSENFETTGVADGGFASGWSNTDFTSVTYNGYLLNPAGTGSPWLNPVPAELGEIFATLPRGAQVQANTSVKFVEGSTYTLTFTQFRRDDTAGLGVTASIGNSGGALESVVFDAVATTDTFVTHTVSYTATSSDNGADIFIRMGNTGTLNNSFQVGIDNIAIDQQIPEPSTISMLGIGVLAALIVRRRGLQPR